MPRKLRMLESEFHNNSHTSQNVMFPLQPCLKLDAEDPQRLSPKVLLLELVDSSGNGAYEEAKVTKDVSWKETVAFCFVLQP